MLLFEHRHFGSFLLDEQDRALVLSIVRALSENIRLPIFVKIRLLDSVPDTIRLCKQLAESGASLIAIHAVRISFMIKYCIVMFYLHM